MVRRIKKTIKRTSVKSKNSDNFSYNPVEPEIVKPKMKSFGRMYKDAGAGVVKYCKVTVIRDNKNKTFLKIKSGKIGKVVILNEEKHDNFEDACDVAKEFIKKQEIRGYKIK